MSQSLPLLLLPPPTILGDLLLPLLLRNLPLLLSQLEKDGPTRLSTLKLRPNKIPHSSEKSRLTFLPTISQPLVPSKSLLLNNKSKLPSSRPLLFLNNNNNKLPLNNPLKTSSSDLVLPVSLNPRSERNKKLSFSPVLPLESTESVFNSVASTCSMETNLRSVNKVSNNSNLRLLLNNNNNNLKLSNNNNRVNPKLPFSNNKNKFPFNSNKLLTLNLNKSKLLLSNNNNSSSKLLNSTSTNNTSSSTRLPNSSSNKITLVSLNLLPTLTTNNNLPPSLVTLLLLLLTDINNSKDSSRTLNKEETRINLPPQLLLPLTPNSSNPRPFLLLITNNLPPHPTLLLPSLNNNKLPLLNPLTPRSTRSLNSNSRKLLSARLLTITRASTVKIV